MREQDLLIQRFLADDLTPQERVTFLQAVDADPSLRRRWSAKASAKGIDRPNCSI